MAGTISNAKRNSFKVELLVVFAFLISLGFPGNYALVYGEQVETVMAYAVFIAQILAMLLSSGNSWLDVQIINLDKKYTVIYLFAAVIFVESMWVAEYKDLEFITCTRLVVTILFVIWLQNQFNLKRMMELICIAHVLFVLFNLIFAFQYPNMAFERETGAFLGLCITKNTCGIALAFGIIFIRVLIWKKIKENEKCYWWTIIFMAEFFLLLMCQATGALVCTICVLVLFSVFERVRLPIGWMFIAGSILFLFLTLTLMPAFEWVFELLGKDATLTGRIPLWNQIIAVMTEHNTFTGFGYGMFWRDEKAVDLVHAAFIGEPFLGNMTSGAHNMLLEFWLNSGLIGLGMLFTSILYSARRAKELPIEKYVFMGTVFAFIMINGFTERSLGGNYDFRTMAFFLALAMGCRHSGELDETAGVKIVDN